MTELESRQRKVLEQLAEDLKAEEIAALLDTKEETGMPFDFLDVVLDDLGGEDGEVFAQMFFQPMPEEQAKIAKVQYFTCIINVKEEIEEKNLAAAHAAASILNYFIPFGTFCLDPDQVTLLYKFSSPLPADMDQEQLHSAVNLLSAQAANLCDQYYSILSAIASGEAQVSDLGDFFPVE